MVWRSSSGGRRASRFGHVILTSFTLAKRDDPTSLPPTPSVRFAGNWARRRNGSIARLPVPLYVLRKREFPERIPKASTQRDPRGVGRSNRARSGISLFHR